MLEITFNWMTLSNAINYSFCVNIIILIVKILLRITLFNNKIDDDYKTFTPRFDASSVIFKSCKVTVTWQFE